MLFLRYLLPALLLVLCKADTAHAQYGQMPPFTISMEAITTSVIPGLHSFAFARSGDKWLIIGGRTNGLHGLNSSDGFPPEYKNEDVIVIDTTTWTFYSADLNQLPYNLADPLRSTNMQYVQDGDHLYMTGGFGYDSIAGIFVTFPKLSAIHVDNMIDAVINAQPIAPHIRQVTDTTFAICGGEMGKIGSDYYLCFGHNFGGRYSDPPTPLFTQQYSEKITKFTMSDDGTSISFGTFNVSTDTNNFHRRDLNMGPIVQPDGSFALSAYGGVFKKTQNLPFREPITISPAAISLSPYLQVMSQYTCALLPVYDSVTQNMYTTFFGGISLYDFIDSTGLVMQDSLVPFIDDITTLTKHADGTYEETVLPIALPGLLGSNAKFVVNEAIAHYSNEVIHLRKLPNTKVLAGYLFGGIRAQEGNFGSSSANDTIYRIYLTPSYPSDVNGQNQELRNITIFPNPAKDNVTVSLTLLQTQQVSVIIEDVMGKQVMVTDAGKLPEGNQKISINTNQLKQGVYLCRIRSERAEKTLKLVVGKY
jgi:hypothetical protein